MAGLRQGLRSVDNVFIPTESISDAVIKSEGKSVLVREFEQMGLQRVSILPCERCRMSAASVLLTIFVCYDRGRHVQGQPVSHKRQQASHSAPPNKRHRPGLSSQGEKGYLSSVVNYQFITCTVHFVCQVIVYVLLEFQLPHMYPHQSKFEGWQGAANVKI